MPIKQGTGGDGFFSNRIDNREVGVLADGNFAFLIFAKPFCDLPAGPIGNPFRRHREVEEQRQKMLTTENTARDFEKILTILHGPGRWEMMGADGCEVV